MALKQGITLDEIVKRAEDGVNFGGDGALIDMIGAEVLAPSPAQIERAGKENISSDLSQAAEEQNAVVVIGLDKIQPSPMNNFFAYPEEEKEILKNSLEQQGQLEPIIVRPKSSIETYEIEKDYEILAGRNRYEAMTSLGWMEARCAVYDVDDITASCIITQSNIQRSISEMEVARSYRNTYDLMKNVNGGDRKSEDYEEQDKNTLKELATKYGIGQTTMYRKIRLTYLVPEVLDKYLKGKITQEQAVHISFAEESMQVLLIEEFYKGADKSWLDDDRAKRIGQMAKMQEGRITPNQVRDIMKQEKKDDEESASDNKNKDRRYLVPTHLFPREVKLKERPLYIAEALSYVMNNNIELNYRKDITETVATPQEEHEV